MMDLLEAIMLAYLSPALHHRLHPVTIDAFGRDAAELARLDKNRTNKIGGNVFPINEECEWSNLRCP